MDTKFVLLWIVGIVAVSFMTVLAESSITGDITGEVTSYRSASKIYGPGLRRALEKQAYQARFTSEQSDMQMYQGKILANKDRLVCGGSPDGPTPCMFFDDKKQWCCLPSAPKESALAGPKAYVYVPLQSRTYK